MAKDFDKKQAAAFVLIILAAGWIAMDLLTSYLGERQQAQNLAENEQQQTKIVRNLVSSEELLLELTPRLRRLSGSVLNLRLPDHLSVSQFAPEVTLVGSIGNFPATENSGSDSELTWQIHAIGDRREQVPADELLLLEPLFQQTRYFEHAGFYFIEGTLTTDAPHHFDSTVGLDGLAVDNNGKSFSFHGEFKVDWVRPAGGNTDHWKINRWELVQFKSLRASSKLFRDVTAEWIFRADEHDRATTSRHAQLTSHLMSGGEYVFPSGETYPYFFPDVTLEHPGISVVDIDRDGLEDLYVSMQHDENLLFRNRGDGTLEEVAEQFGLNIKGDSTCAIFADFDNDGDPDLFLGRARRPSMYLVNQNGEFVEQTRERIQCNLPALVSSMAVADYDNDGLLDIYISTYSPIEESNRFHVNNQPMWMSLFLDPAQADEFIRRNQRAHRFMDRAGPPNLLLHNIGNGEFEVARENGSLQLWRMTFQAAWNDFDRDGDPDLYVANDYGPDNLFRNDGADGFKDITGEAGLQGLGFGMGVSWGDYDNDGQDDIYVSNMFSKAGRRITGQVPDIDPRIREMAQGNFLYRQVDGKFKQVAGLEKPDLQVAKAGWSWGGQFFDFDNDGFRDIYVTSGYYTAPPGVAVDLDL